jgi:tRNA(Arg) A34 adenosine deaminase TadA
MCSGAIYWASIRELVFACSSEQLGQIAGDHLNTSCREILNFGVCPTKIRDYSYMKQFQVIHQNYWV